jgi:biotin-(acetyl-CoA carboxylase) ligase
VYRSYYSLYSELISSKSTPLTIEQKIFFEGLGLSFSSRDGLYSLIDYQLYDPFPVTALTADLPLPFQLYCDWTTSSTIDLAMQRSVNSLSWADGQLTARGQYNRRWCSALGRQIQCTLALYNSNSSPLIPIYSLMLTLRILQPQLCIKFKWPNDLYLDGGKIAGMLVQHSAVRTLISFGLNTTFFNESYKIHGLWKDAHKVTRIKILQTWLNVLSDLLENPDNHQIEKFLTDNHLLAPNAPCKHSMLKCDEFALFERIDSSGALILRTDKDSKIVVLKEGSFILE